MYVNYISKYINLGYLAASSRIDRIKKRYKTEEFKNMDDWEVYPYSVGVSRRIKKERGFTQSEIERLLIGSQNVAFRSLLDKM